MNTTDTTPRSETPATDDQKWFGFSEGEYPDDPEPGSDEEAYVLARFTDLLSRDIESPKAKELRNRYTHCERLARMMDGVLRLKTALVKRRGTNGERR
jgi:hypothetical protein